MIWGMTGPRYIFNDDGSLTHDGEVLTMRADQWLDTLPFIDPAPSIIGGLAAGMDIHVHKGAQQRGIPVKGAKPDWEKHGKRAGFVRNGEMVDEADVYVGFWNGVSRGTRNYLEQALVANKLRAVYFSNGVIWSSGDTYDVLDYGAIMNSHGKYHLTLVFAERMRRNVENPKLLHDDGSLNYEKLEYANARTKDAFDWLWAGNVAVRVIDPGDEHFQWFMFPSKRRKTVVHFTAPDCSDCTCEGFHPERANITKEGRPCIHMYIVWMWNHRQKTIEELVANYGR